MVWFRIGVIVLTCGTLPGLLLRTDSGRRTRTETALAATSGHTLTVELYLSSPPASRGDPPRSCGPGELTREPGPWVLAVAVVTSRGTVARGALREEPRPRDGCSFEGTFFVPDAAGYTVTITEVGTLSSSADRLARNGWRMTLAMGSF